MIVDVAMTGAGQDRRPDLVDQELSDDGFDHPYVIHPHGQIHCRACGVQFAAHDVVVVRQQRFEGQTNPSDMSLLLALRRTKDCRGTLTVGYGPMASREHVELLGSLPS